MLIKISDVPWLWVRIRKILIVSKFVNILTFYYWCDQLTISTTSTSASKRNWYKNILRSFFICIELSSIWATVKMRILQFFHERCCLRRNGSNMSIPPSCTIHQISMLPETLKEQIFFILFFVFVDIAGNYKKETVGKLQI